MNIINNAGLFPTRNFRTGVFEGAEKISGETLAEKYLEKNKSPSLFSTESRGPEHGTIWAFGAQTGISDL